jgi:hypothetical protein
VVLATDIDFRLLPRLTRFKTQALQLPQQLHADLVVQAANLVPDPINGSIMSHISLLLICLQSHDDTTTTSAKQRARKPEQQ